ncbi:MAG: SDR family oxidoreductase [Gemmatimonadota bacterium]|nr:SDR family oxidoreductase [Gemmatimonadota bacterium]
MPTSNPPNTVDGEAAAPRQATGRRATILLTGATGYVGGRLLSRLEALGHRVRCLARRPEALAGRVGPGTEVVRGDVLDRAGLDAALQGVDVAYYLVHSMGSPAAFEEADRRGAANFGAAAHAAGVRGIIYLGGLGREEEDLSPHLRSRQEVGRLLAAPGIPVLEFRASIVIGSGSLSFEMVRALVERLPLMVTPRWVRVMAQPIAIEDLLEYLVAGLALPPSEYRVYEIGGADEVCYADIMRVYARERGLRLRMISAPVLTPYLSSLWLGLVTPLYARIGRKLIESIIHPTVVRDHSALQAFDVRPMGIERAVRRALLLEERTIAETRWSDALSSAGESRPWGGVRFGTRLVDSRVVTVDVPADAAFAPIRAIGGATGWYAWNFLWRLRGYLDLLVGGVGTRRGRPDPATLRVGDAVDFWRVEAIEPGRRLRLAAEMRLPGRAWLEFEVTGTPKASTIRQTAIFDPAGWLGNAYWYALFPLHQLVFAGMLRGIARAAGRSAGARADAGSPAQGDRHA